VSDRLVWVDCEMTGLDVTREALVEVALVVTDENLAVLDEGLDLVLSAPADVLAGMAEVVREMHSTSGLLPQIRSSTLSAAGAEEQLLAYLRQYVPEPRRAPLCGNTIATDRAFLARDMPALDGWLHYRMIDVSSIKELCRRWYPKVYYHAPAKRRGHRALADILESIDELRYYRATVFVPLPGPDADAAKAAAAEVVASRPGMTAAREQP
jgi:oligoribonuclease